MDKRNNSLDMIAGIFIVYMIVLHILQWSNLTYLFGNAVFHVFSFFMFWFFFKSGMFYREKLSKDILIWGGQKIDSSFCHIFNSRASAAMYKIVARGRLQLDALCFIAYQVNIT